MKINNNTKINFTYTLLSLVLFSIFTILIKLIDVQPIGPLNSEIGFAGLNAGFNLHFGFNNILYDLTNILGYIAILFGLFFGITGLVQLIQKKSLVKVDHQLYALALFYVIVLCSYLLFEILVVNNRPILINNELEASYPSSHTVLATCFYLSSVIEFKRQFKTKKILSNIITSLCIILAAATVIGRLFCGAHWLTDIIGGLLLSASLLLMYKTFLSAIK